MGDERCNDTTAWQCKNGHCIHTSVLCDKVDDCGDRSDESSSHCPAKPDRMGPLEIAAIVIGCIIGTVILCCLLGTIIDCFMHVYKYWCSCLHKAYKTKRPTETIALRNPNFNPGVTSSEHPTVLVVRAVPPTYSTIVVSCDSTGVEDSRCTDDSNRSGDLVCNEFQFENATQLVLGKDRYGCTIINPYANNDSSESLSKQRDICTQTSVERGGEGSTSRRGTEPVGLPQSATSSLSSRIVRSQSAHSRINTPKMEKTPTLEGPLPPSYSSIFLGNDTVLFTAGRSPRVNGSSLEPPR